MLDNDLRKLIARLHRIEGQIRGLESQIKAKEDVLLVVSQFDAVISATKSALNSYVEEIIYKLPDEDRKKLLARFIKKN